MTKYVVFVGFHLGRPQKFRMSNAAGKKLTLTKHLFGVLRERRQLPNDISQTPVGNSLQLVRYRNLQGAARYAHRLYQSLRERHFLLCLVSCKGIAILSDSGGKRNVQIWGNLPRFLDGGAVVKKDMRILRMKLTPSLTFRSGKPRHIVVKSRATAARRPQSQSLQS